MGVRGYPPWWTPTRRTATEICFPTLPWTAPRSVSAEKACAVRAFTALHSTMGAPCGLSSLVVLNTLSLATSFYFSFLPWSPKPASKTPANGLWGVKEAKPIAMQDQAQAQVKSTTTKMSAGKENWLAKQEMANAAKRLGQRKLETGTSAAAIRAVNKLPICEGLITSSEVGNWTFTGTDNTRTYDLATCRLRRHSGTDGLDARECLRDTHVMFIGDSLTRYQYLSFVQLLATGKFANRSTTFKQDSPNILRESDFHHQFHRREDGQW